MSCDDSELWRFSSQSENAIFHIAGVTTVTLEILAMLIYAKVNRVISVHSSDIKTDAINEYEYTLEELTVVKKIKKSHKNVILPIYYKLLWLFIIYETIMIIYSLALLILSINKTALHPATKYIIIIFDGFLVNFFWYSFMYLIMWCFVQRSSGTKSWKRSAYISLTLGLIHGAAFIFIFYVIHNELTTIYLTIALCCFDLIIFIAFMCYMCKYPRRRYRKSLRCYTLCLFIIHIIWLLLNILAIQSITRRTSHFIFSFLYSSFCTYYYYIFNALRQILFPLLLFFTLKYDSEYWSEMALMIMSSNNASLSMWSECVEYTLNSDTNQNIAAESATNTNLSFDEVTKFASMQIPIFDWTCLGIDEHDDDAMNDSHIGTGTSATVFLGKYKASNVAIKCILCDELDIKTIHLFYKEALLSLSLQSKNKSHPNIVRFLGIAIQPPELCLIYEYCKHKSLTNVLHNVHKYPNINYLQILYIARDIAKGMKYLHKNNIVHRDLKTENILIHSPGAQNPKYPNKLFIAKVCDFGLARKLKRDFMDRQHHAPSSPSASSKRSTFSSYSSYKRKRTSSKQRYLMDEEAKHMEDLPRHQAQFMTTEIGTVAFLPPEILENMTFQDDVGGDVKILSGHTWYAQSVDVFSFGCILWELIMRDELYKEYNTAQDIRNAVVDGRYPKMPQWAPDEYTSLIQWCWQKDPFQRPSFQVIDSKLKKMIINMNEYRMRSTLCDDDCVTDDAMSIASCNYPK